MSDDTRESLEKLNEVMKGKYPPTLNQKRAEIADSRLNVGFLESLRLGASQWHTVESQNRHGETITIYLRILTIREKREVDLAALEWFHSLPEYQRVPELYQIELAIQTLSKALTAHRTDSVGEQVQLNRETLEACTLEAIQFMISSYHDLCQKYNIGIDDTSPEEIEMMVEQLVKKPHLVSNLTRSQLERVALTSIQKSLETIQRMDNMFTK